MSNSEPTTALETLGTYLSGGEIRDAIHLAVVPITATERVYPGQHLTAEGRTRGESVGICDPFLPGPVQVGQQFWLVLYPRTITSLRHVWTHPAFPEIEAINETEQMIASMRWLRERANRLGVDYQTMMEDVQYSNDDDYVGLGTEIDGDREIEPEFWEHAERVLGMKLPHSTYFRCAC